MKKSVKILLWIIGAIGLLAFLFFFIVGPIMKKQTKKHSPEQNISYTQGDLQLNVFYCSPSKKGRKIFGELVPYGEVWRTGANEASTFTTTKDVEIAGQTLVAGKYTLWTIPNEDSWKIIFNSKMYDWGVKISDRKASRDPSFDVLIVEAPVSKSINSAESFSISLSQTSPKITVMLLSWDTVVVPVSIQQK
jgi:hypothetical protein